jgi:hypothetical protein
MNDDTRDIESALGALRPRRLPADLEARLTEAALAPRRPRVLPFVAWGAPLAAAASVAFLLLASPEDVAPVAAPAAMMAAAAPAPAGLSLVRAEQAPAEVTLLEPVKLAEGSFARPIRVRWHNAATYRDAASGAELVRYAPHDEVVGLVPFEAD